MMNDLKLKDNKSYVFSNFEGNAVSASYRFFVEVSLFHPPLCCRSFEFLLHKHLVCNFARNFVIVIYGTRYRTAFTF